MLLVISYLNEFLAPRYGDDLYLTFISPTPLYGDTLTESQIRGRGDASPNPI